MSLYKNNKIRFVIGLILIVLIYSSYYLYFIDNPNLKLPRRARHFVTLITTIVIYFIGTFHLGKLKDSWMSLLWHMVHVSGFIILTSFGLFDWLIFKINLNLRSFAQSVQETLISPVLYVAMGLVNRTFNKK